MQTVSHAVKGNGDRGNEVLGIALLNLVALVFNYRQRAGAYAANIHVVKVLRKAAVSRHGVNGFLGDEGSNKRTLVMLVAFDAQGSLFAH